MRSNPQSLLSRREETFFTHSCPSDGTKHFWRGLLPSCSLLQLPSCAALPLQRETLTHKHIIRHAEGTDSLARARFLSYPRQGNHQRCHFESNQFKEEGRRARACLCLYVALEATRGSITANDLCRSEPSDGG